MTRKELALTVIRAAARGVAEAIRRDTESELADDADCLLCSLIDNDDEEPLRDRLALVMAYGELVLAEGNGVSTCTDCHRAILSARRELKRELRDG